MSPFQVRVSDAWLRHFPEAHVGLLEVEGLGTSTPGHAHPRFEACLRAIEAELRQRYAGADRATLLGLPVVHAYQQHYRAAGQTYHVLRQLESIALKGRPIGSQGGVVVSAMFAAELESLLLTAGHDADRLIGPLVVDRSREGERFVGISGEDLAVKPGDMLMRDAVGIISAVLSGPDHRTRLSDATGRALFVAYAPASVSTELLASHLDRLGSLVGLAVPTADVGTPQVYPPEHAATCDYQC